MIAPFVLIVLSAAGVLAGRCLSRRWLNHLSVYAITWGVSLVACEVRLLNYNPIRLVAWVYMAAACLSFFLGAALVEFAGVDPAPERALLPEFNPAHFKALIIVLCVVSSVSLVEQVRQTNREFGGILNAILLNPNQLYGLRTEGELGGFPYFTLFAFPATCLAGAYTARTRRVTLVGLFPLLIAGVGAVVAMQRAGLVMNTVLFLYAYAFFPGSGRFVFNKQMVFVSVLIVIMVSGFLAIGSHRGSYVYFQGQTRTLNSIAEYLSSLPALYAYVSEPPPAFNQYLLHPEADTNDFFGCYTFASIYRLLAKLRFRTYVPYYPPYYYTPADTNQATYLAYIHSDFGPAGIVLVPFALSALLSFLARRNANKFRLWRLMVYVNLLLVVTFSFSGYYLTYTYWSVGLILGALLGWWMDNAADRQQTVPAPV